MKKDLETLVKCYESALKAISESKADTGHVMADLVISRAVDISLAALAQGNK